MITPSYDVCDLNNIRHVPKELVETYLAGGGFEGSTSYTPAETLQIFEDAKAMYAYSISQQPLKERVAIITAGAPGAGKSTLLKTLMHTRDAFTDPDERCLVELTGYKKDIEEGVSPEEAYRKWRAASNGVNHLLLAAFINTGIRFCFGTTATSDKVGLLFDHLHSQRYSIEIIHVTTPDAVRKESVAAHAFHHTTLTDIEEKGVLLPQRINDYLQCDKIDFYFRKAAHEDAVHAASRTKIPDAAKLDGRLVITDLPAYEEIEAYHNAGAQKVGKLEELSWVKTVETCSTTAIEL